jgi:nucleoside-diphosphate-sugar epimerase
VPRILVTGAGGFIGAALCPVLAARGHNVIAGLRRSWNSAMPFADGIEPRVIGEVQPGRDWGGALGGADVVVHLAQRAHRRTAPQILADEPEAAAALARAAAQTGVRRFVFISSIKALGEASLPARPFRADDAPRPEDSYGRAKLASERALAAVAEDAGLELVVIRPPLVYGPGVAGNFRALGRLAASGLPLPFAALVNRRSLIFVGNLADLIATAATHPAAVRRTWLAADGADLTVAELIMLLAAASGRRARLFAVPNSCFAVLRCLPGLAPAAARLSLPLQIDDTATRAELGWAPPFSAEDALSLTARALAATR